MSLWKLCRQQLKRGTVRRRIRGINLTATTLLIICSVLTLYNFQNRDQHKNLQESPYDRQKLKYMQLQHQQRNAQELQQHIQYVGLQLQLKETLPQNNEVGNHSSPATVNERFTNSNTTSRLLKFQSNFQAKNISFSEKLLKNNSPQLEKLIHFEPVNRNKDRHSVNKQDVYKDVNIVSSYPAPSFVLPYKDCVPLPKFPLPGIHIFLHPVGKDEFISGNLKANPSLMLLDLGCNIGEYTIWAAALGREVVAVDMLMSNIELLQTSLQLNGLGSLVTIVNNAIYSRRTNLDAIFMAKNLGGSRLNTSRYLEILDVKRAKVTVKTICLDDLVPLLTGKSIFMKMDIENSEHHAFSCAHKLFSEADIQIVQMEWMNKTQEEEIQILQFMKYHGYIMSSYCLGYEEVDETDKDVYFLKK